MAAAFYEFSELRNSFSFLSHTHAAHTRAHFTQPPGVHTSGLCLNFFSVKKSVLIPFLMGDTLAVANGFKCSDSRESAPVMLLVSARAYGTLHL